MTVYVLAHVKVNDDSWLPDYAANVHDIVHKHGGKYLSRSANITTIEGESSGVDLIALIEFPTMEAVQAFGSDPEYAPYGEARIAGTVSRPTSSTRRMLPGRFPISQRAANACF